MDEISTKLNYYLNEMCKYLEKEEPFLLDNIYNISCLNDEFNDFISKYNIASEVKENHLTFLDVYNLTREIIASIDESYLEDYDKLITSGELDFAYEEKYGDSYFEAIDNIKKIINLQREFNYNDVIALVHEFIHYTNFKGLNLNRHYLTEFLSIYFETYAIDYLIKKGISINEIGYFDRLNSTRSSSNHLYDYEFILLTYSNFGNISDKSLEMTQKYFMDMQKEKYLKEYRNFLKELINIEKQNKDKLEKNPQILGEILCDEFITKNYRYILGTILAMYVFAYGNFKDVVYLNNHINEYQDKSVYDICLSIGVDLDDSEFANKAFTAIDNYLNSFKINKTR